MGRKSDAVLVHASAARTASGTGSITTDLSAYETGALLVSVTAASGTTPTLMPYLQVSPNNGSTWFGSAASATSTPVKAGSDITATGQYYYDLAGYAGGLARLAWTIGGTSPSFTFAAWLIVRR